MAVETETDAGHRQTSRAPAEKPGGCHRERRQTNGGAYYGRSEKRSSTPQNFEKAPGYRRGQEEITIAQFVFVIPEARMTSFLVRTIAVEVDLSTWGRKTFPPQLAGASGTCTIDIGEALHTLGTLTLPNLLSPASPALYWAWLRYYRAPTRSRDLRITMDFSDLDPHQKGILSDDFGVALATQWLIDRLGGYRQIVDGRRFANQFQHLLRRRRKLKAKVGPTKAPDYVIRDIRGKWHVLECKGTQTGRAYQRKVLQTAIAQKHTIEITGRYKGEQLAASLFIAHEQEKSATHLKIIDPEEPPLIHLTADNEDEMETKANRLVVAQALGSIGLNEIALEMSLPSDVDPDSDLLLPSEVMRVRSSREARLARAAEQARETTLVRFTHGTRAYEGRETTLDLPPTATQLPFRKVRIRQGVTPELIREVSATGSLLEDNADQRVKPYAINARINVESDSHRTALTYGDVLYSEMIWT